MNMRTGELSQKDEDVLATQGGLMELSQTSDSMILWEDGQAAYTTFWESVHQHVWWWLTAATGWEYEEQEPHATMFTWFVNMMYIGNFVRSDPIFTSIRMQSQDIVKAEGEWAKTEPQQARAAFLGEMTYYCKWMHDNAGQFDEKAETLLKQAFAAAVWVDMQTGFDCLALCIDNGLLGLEKSEEEAVNQRMRQFITDLQAGEEKAQKQLDMLMPSDEMTQAICKQPFSLSDQLASVSLSSSRGKSSKAPVQQERSLQDLIAEKRKGLKTAAQKATVPQTGDFSPASEAAKKALQRMTRVEQGGLSIDEEIKQKKEAAAQQKGEGSPFSIGRRVSFNRPQEQGRVPSSSFGSEASSASSPWGEKRWGGNKGNPSQAAQQQAAQGSGKLVPPPVKPKPPKAKPQ